MDPAPPTFLDNICCIRAGFKANGLEGVLAEVELLGIVLEGDVDVRGFVAEGVCPGTPGAG